MLSHGGEGDAMPLTFTAECQLFASQQNTKSREADLRYASSCCPASVCLCESATPAYFSQNRPDSISDHDVSLPGEQAGLQ